MVVVLRVFSCAYWPLEYLLWWGVRSNLWPSKNWVVYFFYYCVLRVLYMFWIIPLSDMWFENIFSQSVAKILNFEVTSCFVFWQQFVFLLSSVQLVCERQGNFPQRQSQAGRIHADKQVCPQVFCVSKPYRLGHSGERAQPPRCPTAPLLSVQHGHELGACYQGGIYILRRYPSHQCTH